MVLEKLRNLVDRLIIHKKLKECKVPKYHCQICLHSIQKSEIKGNKRTKRQTYNFLKSKSLDGKFRCKSCMVAWLERKIDELI